MLKKVLKDGVIYAFANGLFGIVHVGLFFLAANHLDRASMGAVEMVYSMILLLQMVVALEVSQAVGRFTAEADHDDRSGYISSAWWFSLLAHGALLAVALPLSNVIAQALTGREEFGRLFQLGFVAAAGWSLYYHARSQLRWLLLPKPYAAGVLVYVALAAALGAWMLYRPRWAVYAIVAAISVASVPAIVMAMWRVRSYLRLAISGRHLRMMLAFSLPLVPSSVAVFLSQYFDRLALAKLMGIESVGLYAMGAKLALLVYLAILGFQGAVVPLVYHEHTRPETPEQLERVFRWFLWLSLSMLLVAGLFATDVAGWLFPAYQAGAVVVPWLAFAVILAQIYIFAPGLVLEKKTRRIAAISIGGAGLNVGLNFLLIPSMGISGAAVATCIAAAVTAAAYIWTSQREYAIPYRYWRIAIGLALAAAFCVTVGHIFPDGLPGPLWVKVIAALVGIAVLCSVLLGGQLRRKVQSALAQK